MKSSSGNALFRAHSQGRRRRSTANDAALATYALQHVVTEGTGTAAALGRPVAGKTGTAENYVDAWFCGYTPQLAACVWVGYPKNETTPMQNIDGFPQVFGGTIPAAHLARLHGEGHGRHAGDGLPDAGLLRLRHASRRARCRRALAVAEPVAVARAPRRRPSPSPSPSPSRFAVDLAASGLRCGAGSRRSTDQGVGLACAFADSSTSYGSDAVTVVPRPGRLRTVNVPPPSSVRSRIEASPTFPLRRKSRARDGSNPEPVVAHLDVQDAARAADADLDRRTRWRACPRSSAPPARRGRRAISTSSGTAWSAPPSTVTTMPRSVSARRAQLSNGRDEAALVQQRRPKVAHQPAEALGLVRQLARTLASMSAASLGVAGRHHHLDRLQRQRGRRDALDRAVVDVARDAVALGLDRRVRPPEQPRAVLVAVLQELEQRADRLVGDPRRGHVADEQQRARWVAGQLRRP